MTTAEILRVLVVEDHPLFRTGLCQVLQDDPAIEVAGAVGSLEEAKRALVDRPPSLALADFRLPDGSGLDLVKHAFALSRPVPVLILSAYDYAHYVQAAVQAGAAGFLLKDEPAPRILAAVHRAARRSRPILSEGVGAHLRDLSPESLTPREEEIVTHLAGGQPLAAISRELGISNRTVRNHLNNIYSKLDLHSQPELVAWAWRTGRLDV